MPPQPAPNAAQASPARYPGSGPGQALWAVLLARIFEILPLRCTLCGAQMRLIAFVTDPPALAFANNLAKSDAPTVAYATVYPLTTLMRILTAQILALTLIR